MLQAFRVEQAAPDGHAEEDHHECQGDPVDRPLAGFVVGVVQAGFAGVVIEDVGLGFLVFEVGGHVEFAHDQEGQGTADAHHQHGEGGADAHHRQTTEQVVQGAAASQARAVAEQNAADEGNGQDAGRVFHPTAAFPLQLGDDVAANHHADNRPAHAGHEGAAVGDAI